MKNTSQSLTASIYQRAILGLAIANCFLLLSCANNQNVDEGAQLEGSEQSASEGASGDAAKSEQTSDLSDLDAAANGTDKAPPAGGDAQAQANPPPGGDAAAAGASGTEDLDKAMAEEAGAGKPDPGANPPPADGGATPPPDAGAAAANPPPADAAGGAVAAADASQPPAGGDATPPPPDAASSGELAPPPGAPGDAANPVADAAAASSASAAGGSASHHAYDGARVPHVKQAAFHKGRGNLNRYYFVRKSDSPKSVSELIYGTGDHAKDLKSWNKGAWKPGKLVYYQSPAQPEDSAMKSFYEERSLTPEQYQVQKGDWISRIAKKKLGSPGSWKEIAVINGLSTADAITRGQSLAIYSDLKGGAAPAAQPQPGQQADAAQQQPGQPAAPQQPANGQNAAQLGGANPAIAKANQPPSQPLGGEPAVAQPEGGSALNQTPPEIPTVAPLQPEGQQPAFLNKKRSRDSGVNVAKLLQQNAFFIVMGLGISALLLALLAINKRKRAGRSDDFNEDGFGATAVKKRR